METTCNSGRVVMAWIKVVAVEMVKKKWPNYEHI